MCGFMQRFCNYNGIPTYNFLSRFLGGFSRQQVLPMGTLLQIIRDMILDQGSFVELSLTIQHLRTSHNTPTVLCVDHWQLSLPTFDITFVGCLFQADRFMVSYLSIRAIYNLTVGQNNKGLSLQEGAYLPS